MARISCQRLNQPLAETFAQHTNGNGQTNRAQAASPGDIRGFPKARLCPASSPVHNNHMANRYMPERRAVVGL
jgi:hypothetical protein